LEKGVGRADKGNDLYELIHRYWDKRSRGRLGEIPVIAASQI